jgi:predicted RNase H-like nuclease
MTTLALVRVVVLVPVLVPARTGTRPCRRAPERRISNAFGVAAQRTVAGMADMADGARLTLPSRELLEVRDRGENRGGVT